MTREEIKDFCDMKAQLEPENEDIYKAIIKILEQEPTKNDLGVDCIDRKATLNAIIKRLGIKNETYLLEAERTIYQQILAMPPVTPQEPKSEWEQDHAILKAYSDGVNEVLDKIRAEIDELYSYVEFDEDLKTSFNMVRLEQVQRVIDKYKAESDDKE